MKRDRSTHDGGGRDGEHHDEYRIRPSESPSLRTVFSVVDATGRDQDELRPLYEVIDPDALDTLVRDSAGSVRLTFRYEGCEIRIDDERVRVGEAAVDAAYDDPDPSDPE
jgi:hypothetical protein